MNYCMRQTDLVIAAALGFSCCPPLSQTNAESTQELIEFHNI
uniref:Uncharacterized protein n=1 Tax=Anguilla anguilla TaxID=7936 RepID=A0A0E9S0S7_ANGAN